MKTVFNDISQVAHLWANHTQETARNNGSFYFDNDTIYSYGSHFPIAKHVNDDTVLFTLGNYSNTTAKHISVVRSASNHLKKIYCYFVNGSTNENFEQWEKEIENECILLAKAKKPEKYLNAIDSLIHQAEIYAEFKGVELSQTLKEAKNMTSKEEYLTLKTKKDELKKAAEEARQKELKKQHTKELTDWRNYKTNRIYVHSKLDYLRYDTQNKRIETTQAVKIPLLVGKNFFETIQKALKKGGCTDCGMKLMEFNVSEINKKFIKVGCHTVEIKEINKLAKKLNWI